MRCQRHLLAIALGSILFVTPALAAESASSKAILGTLLQVGLGLLLPQANAGINASPLPIGSSAAPSSLKETLAQTGVQLVNALAQRYLNPPNTIATTAPQLPAYNQTGIPNYQGMRLAISMLDGRGQILQDRPVGAGFSTGERFKVRLLPTFTGYVTIDNIDASGNRTRIYPEAGQTIEVQAGSEVHLPLAGNQAFEFADSKGEEQLIISVRDPRAQDMAMSNVPVHMQEDGNGSYYVQQVGNGQFASIVQTIRMVHR